MNIFALNSLQKVKNMTSKSRSESRYRLELEAPLVVRPITRRDTRFSFSCQ